MGHLSPSSPNLLSLWAYLWLSVIVDKWILISSNFRSTSHALTHVECNGLNCFFFRRHLFPKKKKKKPFCGLENLCFCFKSTCLGIKGSFIRIMSSWLKYDGQATRFLRLYLSGNNQRWQAAQSFYSLIIGIWNHNFFFFNFNFRNVIILNSNCVPQRLVIKAYLKTNVKKQSLNQVLFFLRVRYFVSYVVLKLLLFVPNLTKIFKRPGCLFNS